VSENPEQQPHGAADTTIGSMYRMEQPEREYCPVHEAIQVLQEKWTLHIVRALLDGPLGFNELGRRVGGCNAVTLKCRLDHLESIGVVSRTVHSYMPPRTTYELAAAGHDLQAVIAAIDDWGRRHLPEEPEPEPGCSEGSTAAAS
jgi:DNA-binding HxlR family transcriptional regulator